MALHPNLAGVLLNNPVGDRQSQPRAPRLASPRLGLGGKEWVVNSLYMLRRNASSGVRDYDADAVAVQRGYTQCASVRHGIFRVQKQIQENLLQPPSIALNR